MPLTKDLIALARARPGELTFASPGAGSAPHLSGEVFQRQPSMADVPTVGETLPGYGAEPVGGTPKEFSAFLRAETQK